MGRSSWLVAAILGVVACGGTPVGDNPSGDSDPNTPGTVSIGLAVKSNGDTIGYLVDSGREFFGVYDPNAGVFFDVNPYTGHVNGNPFHEVGGAFSIGGLSYASVDCSGPPVLAMGSWYSRAPTSDASLIGGVQNLVPTVGRLDADPQGWLAPATELYADIGGWQCTPINSSDDGGSCGCFMMNAAMDGCENSTMNCFSGLSSCSGDFCYIAAAPTTVIPATFPLPITIEEP